MKKYIILAIFLLLPSLTFASFDRNLKYGMNGTDVSDMQDILSQQGCFTNSSTGYFGYLTLEAVKCFQGKNQIEATGYVGSVTRGALNTIIENALTSSTQAEAQEIGTSTPSVICPVGFTCIPISQPAVGSMTPIQTPTPVNNVGPIHPCNRKIDSGGHYMWTDKCDKDGNVVGSYLHSDA